MATVSKWTPFGVALDLTATGSSVTRKSATQYTVKINASWETYYSGAKTNYGMTASSGGGSVNLNTFGTKSSSGSGSFTGTYSISGNGSATKTITVTFKNYEEDWQGNVTESATKNVTFNVTVPALTSYTVKYNANGGTGAPSAQTKWKDQTLKLSTTKPTRTGYTFQGWGTSTSDTSVDYASGANYTSNANITLYAIWKAVTYTVKYNANGGTGAPSSQTKTYGKTLTLSSTKPTRASYINDKGATVSYTFKGWATSASSSTVAYKAGATYTANSSVTLYAVWQTDTTILTYDIVYETGDGTEVMSQIKTKGTATILSTVVPKRNGFTFVSWNTASDGSGTSYSSGSTYSTDADLVLYAIWTPWAHTVTFNINGGFGNVPSNFVKTGGIDQILSEVIPIKSGYTISSWNTKVDGSGLDFYSNEVYNFEQDGGTITLYAMWEINDIYIYANGGWKSREFVEDDNCLNLKFVDDGTVHYVEFIENSSMHLNSSELCVTELIERTIVHLTDESDIDLIDESENYLTALI